jgi:hypothetical protein
MYLRIQATASRFNPAIYISINLAESRRINGKPKQFYVGSVAYIGVSKNSDSVEPNESFWQEVRQRLSGLAVPTEKQQHFIQEIQDLLAAITTAKSDPKLRARLQAKPNKVLSELRRQKPK